MNKYFVYVRTNGKACPQIWHDDLKNTAGKRPETLFHHTLTEEEKDFHIDELVFKYPYREKEDEA